MKPTLVILAAGIGSRYGGLKQIDPQAAAEALRQVGNALAASALASNVVATLADVPFLCHYRRVFELSDASPYHEIAGYLRIHRDKVDLVFNTLGSHLEVITPIRDQKLSRAAEVAYLAEHGLELPWLTSVWPPQG